MLVEVSSFGRDRQAWWRVRQAAVGTSTAARRHVRAAGQRGRVAEGDTAPRSGCRLVLQIGIEPGRAFMLRRGNGTEQHADGGKPMTNPNERKEKQQLARTAMRERIVTDPAVTFAAPANAQVLGERAYVRVGRAYLVDGAAARDIAAERRRGRSYSIEELEQEAAREREVAQSSAPVASFGAITRIGMSPSSMVDAVYLPSPGTPGATSWVTWVTRDAGGMLVRAHGHEGGDPVAAAARVTTDALTRRQRTLACPSRTLALLDEHSQVVMDVVVEHAEFQVFVGRDHTSDSLLDRVVFDMLVLAS
jgi:hypothetical protein